MWIITEVEPDSEAVAHGVAVCPRRRDGYSGGDARGSPGPIDRDQPKHQASTVRGRGSFEHRQTANRDPARAWDVPQNDREQTMPSSALQLSLDPQID
jgi:hypothetical protein